MHILRDINNNKDDDDDDDDDDNNNSSSSSSWLSGKDDSLEIFQKIKITILPNDICTN